MCSPYKRNVNPSGCLWREKIRGDEVLVGGVRGQYTKILFSNFAKCIESKPSFELYIHI